MGKRLTWNEIKKIYKNEYVGLTNIYYKNNDNVTVESAIVQYTSKDTSEAKLLEMASNNEIYLIYITDEFDEGGSIWLLKWRKEHFLQYHPNQLC